MFHVAPRGLKGNQIYFSVTPGSSAALALAHPVKGDRDWNAGQLYWTINKTVLHYYWD